MSQRSGNFSPAAFRLVPLLTVLLGASAIALAQSAPAQAGSSTRSVTSERPPAGASVDDRLKAMEEELRQQNQSLTEMRAIIAEQQRVIGTLSAKTDETKSGEQKAVATVATVTTPSSGRPATEIQTPTLEERVKNVESKVLAIGPFRLSGDFRLRFDGVFRKADPTPPAGFAALTHQQNARMRYRVRLNLDTDIDSRLSFHGQLSTGQVNNPLTADQTLARLPPTTRSSSAKPG